MGPTADEPVPASAAPATDAPATASMATPDSGAGNASSATLLEAYPSPVADGDPGEYVAVRFDRPTDVTGWTLTDGKTTARLPNRTLEGTVALAMAPAKARPHTDHPVAPLAGRLLLADAGDRLELRDGGRTVDTARYRNAPDSSVRKFETGAWQPVGATDFDPVRTDGGTATAFVLPDAPDRTVETLRSAEDRLFLGGYVLTSERVADALLAAHRNGADVRVILDGAPVGGVSERQAPLLDRLADAGVEVRLLAGSHVRYRHHHPKYAVVDDRALVLTENFKPAGTGGMSSRGWGVVLDDAEAADALDEIHAADREWRAATPWSTYRTARDFSDAGSALGEFETRHPPEQVDVQAATVLVTPDNAGDAVESMLDDADERILVQQVEIDGRDQRLLRTALRAADRGVTVRIHLSGAWYVAEDNTKLVEWLNRRADAEGWDLEARVDGGESEGGGGTTYEKIHTKGIVVDDTVIVGSLNWANDAATENREVLVALESGGAADYYAGVFESDWAGDTARSVPAGLLGGTAVALAGGLLAARRIEFVGRDGVVSEWQW